jgi:transcriptional regulator with XRE-family HTH domain
MSFQHNLKQYRELAGYKSAKDFATTAKIPYTSYMNYENKGSWPNEENLIKIAINLDISIDKLLGLDKDSELERCKRLIGGKFKFSETKNKIEVFIPPTASVKGSIKFSKERFIDIVHKYELQSKENIPKSFFLDYVYNFPGYPKT